MIELERSVNISLCKFYKLWNQSFDNYKIHKSSAFSKCDKCIYLKVQLQIERRGKQRTSLMEERSQHLQAQQSRRNVYCAAHARAKVDPKNFFYIIHDKMDQNKTWLPHLFEKPKSLAGDVVRKEK
jgi:hypothetical protein